MPPKILSFEIYTLWHHLLSKLLEASSFTVQNFPHFLYVYNAYCGTLLQTNFG